MISHTLFIAVCIILASCSTLERLPSEYVTAGSDLSATSPTAVVAANLNDGSVLYQQAAEFDRWLKGALNHEASQQLKDGCQKGAANPFCYSLLKSKPLLQIKEFRERTRTPVEIRPVLPIKAEFHRGKITNWKALRKAQVPQLLKGFLTHSSEELQLLKNKTLKERACPNAAAIALAATLEDFLPADTNPGEIAALYLHGGRCAKRQAIDYEHFLTRSALFFIAQGQWKKANEILRKVRPTDAFSGRALYWLHRSFLALGEKEKSQKAFEQLTRRHPFSFHALIAWKESNTDPGNGILEEKNYFAKRSHRKQANSILEEIELLKKYGFDYSASLLVDTLLSMRKVESPVRAYAASLGDPRAKITTASEHLLRRSPTLCKSLMELAFPKAFYPLFLKYGESRISPYLAMSIARRESSFDPRAVSHANAQGLLQINPETGLKLTNGQAVDLLDPAINIGLGTRYLSDLIHRQFSSVYLAIAAYNAGEASVEQWIKRYPKTDPILFIDLIPYRETRDYVGIILSNYFWYRRIYEGAQPTSELIP